MLLTLRCVLGCSLLRTPPRERDEGGLPSSPPLNSPAAAALLFGLASGRGLLDAGEGLAGLPEKVDDRAVGVVGVPQGGSADVEGINASLRGKRKLQRSLFEGGAAAHRKETRSKTAADRERTAGVTVRDSKEKRSEEHLPSMGKKAKRTVVSTPREEEAGRVRRQGKRKLAEAETGQTAKRTRVTKVGVDRQLRSGGSRGGGRSARQGFPQKARPGGSKVKQVKQGADSEPETSSAAAVGGSTPRGGSSPNAGPALDLLRGGRDPAVDWVTEEKASKVFAMQKGGYQANKDPAGHTKLYAPPKIRWVPHFFRFILLHTKPVDNHFRGSTSRQLMYAYAKWSRKSEAKLRQYTWEGETYAEEVAPLEGVFILRQQVTQIILKGVLGFGEANTVNKEQAAREKIKTGKYFRLALV